MIDKPLTPLAHVYYDVGDLDDGVWLDPPADADCVFISAELFDLYWRHDAVIPFPGHRLPATKWIEYHGDKLNYVTLRGSGRAAVTFYRM